VAPSLKSLPWWIPGAFIAILLALMVSFPVGEIALGAFIMMLGSRAGVIRGAFSRFEGPGVPINLVGRIALFCAGLLVFLAGVGSILGWKWFPR
jgi:hypothetical protein